MFITNINQNNYKKNFAAPTFQARVKAPKVNENILNDLSGQLFSGNISLGDSLDIPRIVKDPKKNKVFLATLASLLTATAAKITELITGDTEEKVSANKSEDIIELSTKKEEIKPKAKRSLKKEIIAKPIKFIKHKGTKAKNEIDLEASINSKINTLNLGIDKQNQLIGVYNQFCGLNHKKTSFNDKNEEIQNIQIATEFNEKLKEINDTDSLDKLFTEFEIYTSEKKDLPEPEREISIPKIIQTKNNIKTAYINLSDEERNLVDKFLDELGDINLPLQKGVLQKINANFADVLPKVIVIYNSLADEKENSQKNEFLSNMANNLISKKAVEKWDAEDYSENFTFLEFNSLIANSVSDESIDSIDTLKKNLDISTIKLDYFDNKTTLTAPKVFVHDWFKTILNIFKILHKESDSLNYYEKDYNTSDLQYEIMQNKNSYPNLVKYLSMENKTYLNKGKMTRLLQIYNKASINKDLFTLHSYLRFLERYVMPELKAEDGKYISSNLIERTYVDKLVSLKNQLKEAMNKPVEIVEYDIDGTNIKAPKIKIPMDSKENKWYEITINNQGKIHTIF